VLARAKRGERTSNYQYPMVEKKERGNLEGKMNIQNPARKSQCPRKKK
jgi:hypothetical protein